MAEVRETRREYGPTEVFSTIQLSQKLVLRTVQQKNGRKIAHRQPGGLAQKLEINLFS